MWRYTAPRYAPNRLHLFAAPEAAGAIRAEDRLLRALPALVSGKTEPREESRPPWTIGPATIDRHLGDLYG